jgi:CRISPR/Cas system CSM-associated protein Csm4 (group 5 of RAMP superfamily)
MAPRVDSFACVEFESGSGLWCIARFRDAQAESHWSDRVKAAFRLLADTGFGGGRVIGWGQTAQPELQAGTWPNLLFPRSAKPTNNGRTNGDGERYWLLSLYSPAQSDSLDWSGGDYELITRGTHANKAVKMISEGSVLLADQEPSGTAIDIAPDGHQHPIYRAGFALALRLPATSEEDIKPVEEPPDQDAPEAKPCPQPQRVEESSLEVAGDFSQLPAEPEAAVSEPEPQPDTEPDHEL